MLAIFAAVSIVLGEVMVRRAPEGKLEHATRASAGIAGANPPAERSSVAQPGVSFKVLVELEQPVAIYESTRLSAHGRRLLLGQGFNYDPVSELSVIDVVANTTAYTVTADQVYAIRPDHNENTHEFALTSENDVINGSQVLQYTSWLWPFDSLSNSVPKNYLNHSIGGNETAVAGALSGDGKIFVVTVNNQTACRIEIAHLHGAVRITRLYQPSGTFCGAPSINDNGKTIILKTFTQTTTSIVVVDGHDSEIVASVPNLAGQAFVCMNEHGHLIATGFTTINVLHWDAHNRTLDVVYSGQAPANTFLNLCEFHKGAAGGRPVVALQFSSFSFEAYSVTLNVVDWQSKTLTTRWTVAPAPANNTLQNIPQSITFDQSGRALVVTGWGASNKHVPTVLLIDTVKGAVTWSMSTPGSMWGGDVAHISGTTYRIAAGGKLVHANIFGEGGMAYVIDVTL